MKGIRIILLALISVIVIGTAEAKKKYKWEYEGMVEVYTTGQGQHRTQLVKAWAVAKSADKAIEKAKMDAVTAALFRGIPFDESTHGMGVSNLGPLVTQRQYKSNEKLFQDFFRTGEFMNYVRDVNAGYPSGENNMKVPGGRRVGVNLIIDYPGLRKWLQEKGVVKGVDGHFRN